MSKRSGCFWFLALVLLFLAVNRSAYKGFFQHDEIDNVSWTHLVDKTDYLTTILSARFQPNNFRPVGHFYFREAGNYFGLDFWKYVVVIHLFHLFNVWLIWLLARRLGASPFAAAAGCFLFAFHMALFDAVWKPMYVFDLLCATFCLLSLLLFARRQWVLSFVSFWLAYRSKEVAVMLPFVLACYEIWFGKRNWKPLIPFLAASLSFGLQGILLNPNKDNEYTVRFTAAALAKTSVFYAQKIFLVPYLGFLLPLGALFARNRRTWFGLAAMALFFVPMLVLPGRLYSAYCYVPFTGLAIAFSGIAESAGRLPLALFFLIFLPLDARSFALQRAETLDHDDGARHWLTTIARFAKTRPDVDTFVYDGTPIGYGRMGDEAAIKYIFGNYKLHVYFIQDAEAPAMLKRERVAILTYDYGSHGLDIVEHKPNMPDASFLTLDGMLPVWQLGEGWHGQDVDHRWIAPAASARLARPEGASRFALRALVSEEALRAVGPVTLRVSLNGGALEPRRFSESGWHWATWDLPLAPAGTVQMVLHDEPAYIAPPESGVTSIGVGACGFVNR